MDTSLAICPYCDKPIKCLSDDHIFSDFLGGDRTIFACKLCNDKYGNSFEGRYSQALYRVKMWLTVLGLPLKWQRDFRWRKAYSCGGTLFDFIVKEGKLLIIRSEPEIVCDAQGRPTQVNARTEKEMRNITAGLLRKKKIKGAGKPSVETFAINFDRFEFDIDAGPDLGRLCLKMCCSAATLLQNFANVDISIATAALPQETDMMKGVTKDARTHEGLDSARPSLSHVIYVERTRDRTYGVVQFFGALQFYCRLGSGSDQCPCAILGVLETISGKETFREVEPLNISDATSELNGKPFPTQWSKKLFDQVSKMGCTNLSGIEIKFKPSLHLSSTSDVWPFGQIPTRP